MHFGLGSTIAGPAGAGKTETVRGFARALHALAFTHACSRLPPIYT
jgi:tRNA A37 threonylcarbamoyladenosine biosynthesis protein TsaE